MQSRGWGGSAATQRMQREIEGVLTDAVLERSAPEGPEELVIALGDSAAQDPVAPESRL